jgi:hypothetical protein
MARVFVPNIYVRIPTEGVYHPKGSEFKVSIGQENSDVVFKIQLVVDGKIRPRLTVSYDYNSRQFESISKAYDFLTEIYDRIPKNLVEGLVNDRDLTEDFHEWKKN